MITGRVLLKTGRFFMITGRVLSITGRVLMITGRFLMITGRVTMITGSFFLVGKARQGCACVLLPGVVSRTLWPGLLCKGQGCLVRVFGLTGSDHVVSYSRKERGLVPVFLLVVGVGALYTRYFFCVFT